MTAPTKRPPATKPAPTTQRAPAAGRPVGGGEPASALTPAAAQRDRRGSAPAPKVGESDTHTRKKASPAMSVKARGFKDGGKVK